MFELEDLDRLLRENVDKCMAQDNDSCNEKLTKCLAILEHHSTNIKKHLSTSTDINPSKCSQIPADSYKQNIPTKCGLNLTEIQRYSRQLILPELRVCGQLKLRKSSVLIVGAGGLGCPAALYLAASGIGRLGIIDADTVDLSNLHRQIAHKERKLGESKAKSLCQAVTDLNTHVNVTSYNSSLSSHNALDIFENYDVILDATDNPATRYLINDACQLSSKLFETDLINIKFLVCLIIILLQHLN